MIYHLLASKSKNHGCFKKISISTTHNKVFTYRYSMQAHTQMDNPDILQNKKHYKIPRVTEYLCAYACVCIWAHMSVVWEAVCVLRSRPDLLSGMGLGIHASGRGG